MTNVTFAMNPPAKADPSQFAGRPIRLKFAARATKVSAFYLTD